MPKKTKDPNEQLIVELVKGVKSVDELFGKQGIFTRLKKAALESLLEAEMTEHLGYAKHAPEGYNGDNSRNGYAPKSVVVADESVDIEVPRDRDGTFEPQLIRKGERRIAGFDDQLVALYARGLSMRDIQEHVREMYDVEVSPDLISRVTNRVHADIEVWQQRELEAMYPIVYFDGFTVRVRDEGHVSKKTAYLVLGIDCEGHKDVLGIWMAESEGAKFWMQVASDLRKRGVEDILIACCDGLKGLPEAIEAVFAKSTVQLCIVHVVRNCLQFVSWRDRTAFVGALRTIYTAGDEKAANSALDAFEQQWGKRYPQVSRIWRENWERISPFFALPAELRRAVYTTNPIESLNRQLRKATKTRGAFPNDAAAMKLLWLAVDRATKKWVAPIANWGQVYQQLVILYGSRFTRD